MGAPTASKALLSVQLEGPRWAFELPLLAGWSLQTLQTKRGRAHRLLWPRPALGYQHVNEELPKGSCKHLCFNGVELLPLLSTSFWEQEKGQQSIRGALAERFTGSLPCLPFTCLSGEQAKAGPLSFLPEALVPRLGLA